MTTVRLYHEDSGLCRFTGRVLQTRPGPEGTVEVILDRTAFYPTGGGQPHDLGRLGGVEVRDVFEEGETVVHRLAGAPDGETLEGEVDVARRRDHRQQHTGQHILSRAILAETGARTVGFHLGSDRSTIDLDRDDLDEGALERAEARANGVVLENLPVTVSWHESLEDLPDHVQKEIPGTGPLRMVSVGEFDLNLCCGTHCGRSGDVGPIKILRWERNKGGLRVEFVCGARAVRDYARRHRILRGLALELTTEEEELPARIQGIQDDFKRVRSRLEKTEAELRDLLADRWVAEEPAGPIHRELEPERVEWLAPLATLLADRGGRPVLLTCRAGADSRVAVACPPGGGSHAGRILKELLSELEGKGGGSDRLARGQVSGNALDLFLDRWRTREG